MLQCACRAFQEQYELPTHTTLPKMVLLPLVILGKRMTTTKTFSWEE